MAEFIEDHKSRKKSITMDASDGTQTAQETRAYTLLDYTSEDAALEDLLKNTPSSSYVNSLLVIRTDAEITPELVDPDRTIYRGRVVWKSPNIGGGTGGGGGSDTDPETDPETPDDPARRSFDFGTRETLALYADKQYTYKVVDNGEVEPWIAFGTAINLDADDVAPEGVAINGESCTWQITKVITGAQATNAWIKARLDQVWTLNTAEFFGFPARTVALTGFTGDYQNNGNFLATFSFEYRKDQSEPTMSGMHTLEVETRPGVLKYPIYAAAVSGWDYIWYRFRTIERKDPSQPAEAAKIVRYMSSVSVAQVYKSSDFSLLGDLSGN